ncbi:MAG TPA: S-layer homology domain-containing protein [Candidatus Obscuribacterales bacterium]
MKRIAHLAIPAALMTSISLSVLPLPVLAQFNLSQWQGVGDVDGRRERIERTITEATTAGRLTAQQAEPLRRELERINQQETAFKADGKLTFFERMRLVVDLDQLSRQIESQMAERTVASPNVSLRAQEISQQIDEGVASGRLTRLEGDTFSQELARIKARESAFREDGDFSSNEQLTISLDLDHLSKSVQAQLRAPAIAGPSLMTRQAELERKINDLVTGGRLTIKEAEPLRQELNRIRAREAAFKAQDGVLDNEETLTLMLDLERLASHLDRYSPSVTATVPGIDARQEELQRQILEAIRTGRVTQQQAIELRNEFDRIAQAETSFRADGTLSDNETLALARDLDALQKHIESIVPTTVSLPGIDSRMKEVGKRLSEKEASGRLPYAAAQSLRANLARIEEKARFFKSDGVLNDSETLTLAGDLDALMKEIDKSLAPLPDVSSRHQDLQKRINESMASGRLSPAEAEGLRAELQRAKDLEATFRSSEGGLSEQEIVAMNREFDHISSRLDRVLTPLPDLKAREEHILHQLNQGITAGTISPEKASELKEEYDRIADLHKSFSQSDNNLSEWETMSISRDLAHLEEHLKRALAAPPRIDTSGAPRDTQGHWAQPYIATLSKRGTIGGFPDGTFLPDDQITRAQFAAIAVRALNLPPAGRPANFKDVPAKYWGAPAIAAVSDAGLVTGFPDGTFRPEDKITRAQALVILAKALQSATGSSEALDRYKDGASVPAWALPSVRKAAQAGIIVNYPDPTSIRPNDMATRAEVAALTYQTMSNLGEKLPSIRVGLEASGK